MPWIDWNQPIDDRGPEKLTEVQIHGAGRSKAGWTGIVVGREMYCVRIHYVEAVSDKVPCTNTPQCALCRAGLGGYVQGYIACRWPGRLVPFIGELSTNAARMVKDQMDKGEVLQFQTLKVARIGAGRQGKVIASLMGDCGLNPRPQEFDPRPRLMSRWGLNADQNAALHVEQEKPLIQYRGSAGDRKVAG